MRKPSEHRMFLLLGTNLGEKRMNLRLAREQVEERIGEITGSSSVYRSEPWGFDSENDFYNQCLEVNTRLSPLEVMRTILDIEFNLGRVRGGKGYSDRRIDIDLLLYEDLVVDHPHLKIPHPRMAERKFVLIPLAEIAPGVIHPQKEISIGQMLEDCPDPGEVKPL